MFRFPVLNVHAIISVHTLFYTELSYITMYSPRLVVSTRITKHIMFIKLCPTLCMYVCIRVCICVCVCRFADDFSLLLQLRSSQTDERSVMTLVSPESHILLQIRISPYTLTFISSQQRHYESVCLPACVCVWEGVRVCVGGCVCGRVFVRVCDDVVTMS